MQCTFACVLYIVGGWLTLTLYFRLWTGCGLCKQTRKKTASLFFIVWRIILLRTKVHFARGRRQQIMPTCSSLLLKFSRLKVFGYAPHMLYAYRPPVTNVGFLRSFTITCYSSTAKKSVAYSRVEGYVLIVFHEDVNWHANSVIAWRHFVYLSWNIHVYI